MLTREDTSPTLSEVLIGGSMCRVECVQSLLTHVKSFGSVSAQAPAREAWWVYSADISVPSQVCGVPSVRIHVHTFHIIDAVKLVTGTLRVCVINTQFG